MKTTATNPPALFVENLNYSRLILVVTLILVWLMAARSPVDTDLWWHLRAGEEMLRSGQPMLHDSFSYTREGAAWINHSWLSEVILAALFRACGYLGVGLWVVVLATASQALIYFQMDGPALLRAFLVIFASLVSAVVWTARPQLASLALFALVGYLLYLYKWRGKDYLWGLLPVFVLWSNLHGGYALGLMLIGAFGAGEILNRLLGGMNQALPWKGILRLALWALAAFTLVVINPNGVNIWLIPFKTVNVGVLQQFIQEWASPDFHNLVQQPFLWLLFITVATMALAGRRVDGSDLLPFILFGYLALVARRNFGPFALVAVPVLSRSLWPLLQDWLCRIPYFANNLTPANTKEKPVQKQPIAPASLRPGCVSVLNLGIVAILGLVAILKLYVVTQPQMIAAVVQNSFPTSAVTWLKENRPEGRLFNTYNWGGYLTWALPEYPVFVDGRTDLFGDQLLGEWVNMIQAGQGWQASLDRWQVRLVLIEPDRPLARALSSSGWKVISQEKGYVLYGKE